MRKEKTYEKKGIPVRIRKRALLLALLFAITLLQMPITAWAEEWAMATRVTEENLVYSVSNPSNGKIQFYIKVPAGETVSYSVDLIPNGRTDSIDTKMGSYTNSGTSAVSKKITVTVKYFSNKYTIYASYTTGPSASRTIHEDTDNATSALKSTMTSEKFIWTQARINNYNSGARILEDLVIGIVGVISVAITKKYDVEKETAAVKIILEAAGAIAEYFAEKDGNIMTTPKLNCGYAIQMVPYGGGYTQKLIEYNADGDEVQTVTLGTVSLSTISVGVR